MKHLGHAVWPFGGVLTFARHGAVQLPDTGRVVDARVYVLPVATKQIVQGLQRTLNKLAARIIIRQRNPVKQVRTIAAVRLNRLWPTLARKEVAYLARTPRRSLVFFVTCCGIGRSFGGNVYGGPPPRSNVRLLGVTSRTLPLRRQRGAGG